MGDRAPRIPLSFQVVGERALLRAPRGGDVPELRALLRRNGDHLRPWSPAAPAGADPVALTELARSVAAQRRDWRRDAGYAFVVAGREAPHPIVGRCALTGVARGAFQSAHLGYWVDGDRQGGGIATDAVRLAVDFAFREARLHRVQAAVMPRNERSRRVLAKAGFREEGMGRRYLCIAGTWEDHVLCALTREEWAAGQAPA